MNSTSSSTFIRSAARAIARFRFSGVAQGHSRAVLAWLTSWIVRPAAPKRSCMTPATRRLSRMNTPSSA